MRAPEMRIGIPTCLLCTLLFGKVHALCLVCIDDNSDVLDYIIFMDNPKTAAVAEGNFSPRILGRAQRQQPVNGPTDEMHVGVAFVKNFTNSLRCDCIHILQVSAYEIACDQCAPECEGCTMTNPDRALLCEPTLPNTDSLTADGTLESLNLAPGYWRSSNTSTDIRECPRAESCPGGTEGSCAIGYNGTCECSHSSHIYMECRTGSVGAVWFAVL